jgi:adenosylmethionine-8-amino-7-oxononanoate aminotransferase
MPQPPSPPSQVFYRNPKKTYPVAGRSEGIHIYDAEENCYIDFSGGPVVVSIGHGVAEIAEAAAAQMERFSFAHGSQFTHPAQEELARRMAALAPGDLNRLFPLTSGSEAVESAIKLARQYHLERGKEGKHLIIARLQSYHGASLGALSATGEVRRRGNFLPMLLPFPHIAPCHCYRCPFEKTYPECEVECASDLERAIGEAGADSVAAFIAEPLVGAGLGPAVPPPEYFPIIREICDRHDILFIADEVMSGMGRSGKPFAIEHWGVVPDLIATGKGIGSGYAPLGGLLVSDRVYRTITGGSGSFVHSHTYSGHPLACAIGAAVLAYTEKHNLIERCARMGEKLFEALAPLRDHPLVGDIRGKGLFAGVELVRDPTAKEPFPRNRMAAERVAAEAFRRGLIVYPATGGADTLDGDRILIAPPFIITEEEIGEAVSLFKESLDAAQEELAGE